MLGHKGLKVFQLSYQLAMEIFHLSKNFPKEEIYSLTDQIKRSGKYCRSISKKNLPETFCQQIK